VLLSEMIMVCEVESADWIFISSVMFMLKNK
jgi:hypothetical protein